jgi:beta-phosphoglucomutase-like phosphatase (HAD superfamily)
VSRRIGFDLDGVVADWAALWSNWLREFCGADALPILTHRTLPSYDLKAHYALASKPYHEARRAFFRAENIWERVPSLLTAVQWARFHEIAHVWDVTFLTARPASKGTSTEEQSRRWLRRHLCMDAFDVVVADYTDPRPRALQKPDVCVARDICVMVDEHPKAVSALADAGISVIMLAYQYNRDVEHPLVRHVPDFDAVLDLLECI